MIKLRKMRWEGKVAHMGKMRTAYEFLFGKLKGKKQLDRPRCGWQDTINCISLKCYVRIWIGFIWDLKRTVAGSCEHGVEPSVNILTN